MSRVAEILAARYRASAAGRTGSASRDLLFAFNDLLKSAGCLHGPARHEAVGELEDLERRGVLVLERHARDASAVLRVRLAPGNAAALFEHLGEPSPEIERARLAEIFRGARPAGVPEKFRAGWDEFCSSMAAAALGGASLQPFDRSKPAQNERIVGAIPAILAREDESLLRFASAALFKDSKFLGTVRARVEACLAAITGGEGKTLSDFGILENERSFLMHGPVTLCYEEGKLPLGLLSGPVRLGADDLRRARIETPAARCLTVENAAMLHELAKARSGVLLASSGSEGGFANSAVIGFLRALPPEIELWHFGDSDPKGFDILRDLRERSGREIRSLHMGFRPVPGIAAPLDSEDRKTIERLLASESVTPGEKTQIESIRAAGNKGGFEQEGLGAPGRAWPFY